MQRHSPSFRVLILPKRFAFYYKQTMILVTNTYINITDTRNKRALCACSGYFIYLLLALLMYMGRDSSVSIAT